MGIFKARLLVFLRRFQLHDIDEGLRVPRRRDPSREEDKVERPVLVLVGEFDGGLACARGSVVIATHVTVPGIRNKVRIRF